MVEINIPAFPPSVNHCYFHKGAMRIKKPAYRDFEALVARRLPEDMFLSKDSIFSVVIEFHSSDWVTKAGRPKRKDLDNLIKCTLDAIFRTQQEFGVTDAQIFHLVAHKLPGVEEMVVVKIFDLDQQ